MEESIGQQLANQVSFLARESGMKLKAALDHFPFHPILFGLYPALALLANNAYEVRLMDGLRALTLSVLAAIIVFAVIYLFRRRMKTSGVLTSLALTGFFSYGHIYEWARQLSALAFELVRHRYLLPVFLGLLILMFFLFWRNNGLTGKLTPVLNLVSLALVIVPLTTVLRAEVQFRRSTNQQANADEACHLTSVNDRELRDIYYIILDAYASQDVLAETYDFDNRPFIDAMEQRGFYIADDSQSNYATSGLSLASSLNLRYLLLPDNLQESKNQTSHWPSLSQGEVRKELACLGYSVVAFDSGYYWSGWRDADVFLSPTQGRQETMALAGLNAFEAMLVNTTLLRATVDAALSLPGVLVPELDGPLEEHRERILFTFDTLENSVASLSSPKFVFAHVVSPHRPYVFGPNGEPRGLKGPFTLNENPGDDELPEAVAYPDQVQYVNQRVLGAVDGILSSYPEGRKPIVIVQGDHGTSSGAEDRMRILNAYYLPNGGDDQLYGSISPVNTFRVVFNAYFNAAYELLPDISCYSTYDALYDFRVIPNPATAGTESAASVEMCR